MGLTLYLNRPHNLKPQVQNLARKRASEFGHVDLQSLTGGDDDIVVSTTASENEVKHLQMPPKAFSAGSNNVEEKPRGFFADQFEVCYIPTP